MLTFRLLVALSIALFATVAGPSTAAAQRAEPAEPAQPALEVDREELASIESEATAAIVLYAVGLVAHVGGLATAIGISQSICISFTGSCPERKPELVFGFLGVSGVGLLTFFVAVGLDVHSRARRNALYDAGLELSAAPLEGGAALLLRGGF